MFSFIKGFVAALNSNSVVIDCNGIGYEICASSFCLNGLNIGSELKLLTALIVREDDICLYGFKDQTEKDMFSRLTSISGIGPKLAIGILSGIDAKSLISCIATQDINILNSIKGVGKKTAERILLELRGKINTEAAALQNSNVAFTPAADDAVLALMTLGYSNAEAVSALSKVEGKEKMSVEEIIMAALRG